MVKKIITLPFISLKMLCFFQMEDIIVTRSDGTMITILKNAMGSKHFNKATTIWTR